MNDIKSMKLYNRIERIYNELAELGIGATDPLEVAQLSRFDQLHYHGTDALDVAAKLIGAKQGQYWIEIGSGIGGPARYLADQHKVNMIAVELQEDQHELAAALTGRCGLSDQVRHYCGDFLDTDWEMGSYEAVVSWLALYHIPQRERLLDKCRALLRPGGKFYAEDLCALEEIDAAQWRDLERDLYAVTLPEIKTYRRDLEDAGFIIQHVTDMSTDWAEYAHRRLETFRADRARHERVHGAETVAEMEAFYSAVDEQFQSGKLGGIRVCARTGD